MENAKARPHAARHLVHRHHPWHARRRRWRRHECLCRILHDGIYPVTPGVPIYNITSPVFDRVAIHLHGGKSFSIVCRNNSAENKYIQSIKLNGQPRQKVWISHADIINGGTLELEMGSIPNKELGASPTVSTIGYVVELSLKRAICCSRCHGRTFFCFFCSRLPHGPCTPPDPAESRPKTRPRFPARMPKASPL